MEDKQSQTSAEPVNDAPGPKTSAIHRALTLRIGYLIALPAVEESSHSQLQHFSYGLLSSYWLIRDITRLPSCVPELMSTKDEIRQFRIAGLTSYSVYLLEDRFLPQFRFPEVQPFFVVFSTDATATAVEAWTASFANKPLHISSAQVPGAHQHIDRPLLRRFIRETAQALGYHELAKQVGERIGWRKRRFLSFERTAHNTSSPNEHCLVSSGYAFRSIQHIIPNPDDAETTYLEAMRRSGKKIAETRRAYEHHSWPATPGLIITLPGLDRDVIKRLLSSRKLRSAPTGADLRDALVAIRDQSGYSFQLSPTLVSKIVGRSAAQHIFAERTEELNAYTVGLEIRAASELSAVYRLPARVDSCRTAFVRVGDCYRGNSAKRKIKLRKELRLLRQQLRESVGESLYEALADEPNAVRLVADLPLEWLPSTHQLPLMLTHETSRITTLPGNLALQQVLPKQPLRLPVSAFKQVLIVRSFRQDDRIRDHLMKGIELLSQDSLGFSARVVDVSSADEFVDALNTYNGSVLVFDGHGQHRGEHGALCIGESDVDVWQLGIRGRVPPIVLLSACDTHPIDRTYASVANGFLAAGARTVLGSLLPIGAGEAGLFAFRLLHAALRMIPMLLNNGYPAVRWSQVVSRTLRSQLMIELNFAIAKKMGLDKQSLLDAQARTTIMNALGHPTWFPDGLEVLAQASGSPVSELRRVLDEEIVVPECMLYTQLGDPESIIIGDFPFDLLALDVPNEPR